MAKLSTTELFIEMVHGSHVYVKADEPMFGGEHGACLEWERLSAEQQDRFRYLCGELHELCKVALVAGEGAHR